MIAKSLIQSGVADSVKIFYSYSRKDSTERDLIEQAIANYEWDIETEAWKRDKVLQWYDEGIQGGEGSGYSGGIWRSGTYHCGGG